MYSLKRSVLKPNSYEYLSEEDSLLFDKVKDSDNRKDKIIKELLLSKLNSSKTAHYMCNR